MEALSASDVAGLSLEEISQISAADISSLSPEAMAGFTAEGMAALPPDTFGALTSDQVSNIDPNSFQFVNADQIGALTMDAMSGVTESQVGNLASHQPDIVFSAEQISNMADLPTIQSTMYQYQMNGGELAQSFTASDMQHFSPEMMSWFPPAFVGELSPEVFGALTADQVSNIHELSFEFVNADQIGALTMEAMSGVTGLQVGNLSYHHPDVVFSAEQISNMADLPTIQSTMYQYQWNGGELAQSFTASDMQHFSPEMMNWFPPAFVGELSPEVFGALTADQVSNIHEFSFEFVNADQIGALTMEAMSGVTGLQVGNLAFHQPDVFFSAEQISNMADLPMIKDTLTQYQMNGGELAQSFTASDMQHFSPEMINWFPTAFVGELSPEVFGALTADQVSNIPELSFEYVNADQIGALTMEAMSGVTGLQVMETLRFISRMYFLVQNKYPIWPICQ